METKDPKEEKNKKPPLGVVFCLGFYYSCYTNQMQKSLADKVLKFLVLSTLFLMPLLVFRARLFPYTTSKSFFFLGVAEAAFFLWIYLAVTNPIYRLSKKQILVFMLPTGFLAVLTLSGIMAPNRNLAFWSSFERGTGLIFFYHALLFSLVVASIAKVEGKKFIRGVFWAIFISGITLAISTFFDTQGGFMGNTSYSGAYLILSFLAGAVLLNKNKSVGQKIALIAGLLLMLSSSFFIQARGASIALVAGVVLTSILYLVFSSKKYFRIISLGLLALFLASSILGGISFLRPTGFLHEKFVKLASSSRFIFWEAGLRGIKEKPLIGWGPENYGVVYTKYFNNDILGPGGTSEVWVDKPHNALLEEFVAGGFVGGILFSLFILSFFVICIYLYRKKALSRLETSSIIGLLFAYFLQDLIIFDTVSTYVVIFTIFGLLSGILPITIQAQMQKKNAKTVLAKKDLKIFLSVICAGMFLTSWFFLTHLPDKKAKALYNLYSKGVDKNFNIMTSISPMGEGRDIGYLADLLAGTLEADINGIKSDPKKIEHVNKDITSFLLESDKLSETAKADYRLWLSSARLLNFSMAISNNFDPLLLAHSLAYLDRAHYLAPNDPNIYVVYGQTYIYKKDLKAAHESFVAALDVAPLVPWVKENLEQFEKIFGAKFK